MEQFSTHIRRHITYMKNMEYGNIKDDNLDVEKVE
jgi:hypothetical protein